MYLQQRKGQCFYFSMSVLAHDAASYRSPLLSGSVCGCVCLSVRSRPCAIQTMSELSCNACSIVSHITYWLVCLSVYLQEY